MRPLLYVTAEARSRAALIVVAHYLREATRQRLRDGGVGYLDLTGNIQIVVSEPGLYIETQGAREDPDREERPARSLRGAKTGRVVRMLIDHRQPPGVRELAALTNMDAGYVSRVLALLDAEALDACSASTGGRFCDAGRRRPRSRHAARRGPTSTPTVCPRSCRASASRTSTTLTGSLRAAAFAPLAPTPLAAIWMCDATAAAERPHLRPTAVGANVLLIEPNDDVVFEGATQRDDIRYAAPSQIAADLLSSPGRDPAEGEALIQWMLANEENWRQ